MEKEGGKGRNGKKEEEERNNEEEEEDGREVKEPLILRF